MSTDNLYFACLEHFQSHYQFFFVLKSRFFNFCDVSDFENLHYLFLWNDPEDDVSEEKYLVMIVHLQYVT